ncbi:MAG: VOC family protein [Myxococcota bacterium]
MDLNQITLPVTDFEQSVEFYQRLGLRLIVSARGEYARFELPSGSATLSLHRSQTPVVNGPLVYFEVDDVDQRTSELRALGVTFDSEPRDERWLWREVRLTDPSGNRLCIYHAGVNRRYPPWRLDS